VARPGGRPGGRSEYRLDGRPAGALPAARRAAIRAVFDRYAAAGVQFHALRTRESGARRFMSVHVLVPGGWMVQRGHALLEGLERDIGEAVPGLTVFTHLESLDDPASWNAAALDRPRPQAPEPGPGTAAR
jgi:divalent metal cation (Fe/Co/Zn/Cd) transporter